jgi:hypothetical protein
LGNEANLGVESEVDSRAAGDAVEFPRAKRAILEHGGVEGEAVRAGDGDGGVKRGGGPELGGEGGIGGEASLEGVEGGVAHGEEVVEGNEAW